MISAVKLADDGSGDVVVRLYEALGARTAVRLDLGFAASAVTETDLLERPFDNGRTGVRRQRPRSWTCGRSRS